MVEDFLFLRKNVVDVDAAVIGISKSRWIALTDSEACREKAHNIMRQHHFDLVPIVTNDDIVSGYYQTETWNNYDSIERKEMDYDDVIPVQTPLHVVIKSLAREKRLFYFLTQHNRVTGLLSFVHLNKRQVRIYIYALITELETRLSCLIRSKIREEEIERYVQNKDADNRYITDKERGIESELMEYLYLSDLINIISKNNLYGVLGYPSRKKYGSSLGSINTLRNEVAHPTRTLISNITSIEKLWNKIEDIERILFRLRQYQEKSTIITN